MIVLRLGNIRRQFRDVDEAARELVTRWFEVCLDEDGVLWRTPGEERKVGSILTGDRDELEKAIELAVLDEEFVLA